MTNKIGSGATPRGGSSVYTETGVSFIRSQNVLLGSFSFDGLAFIDDAAAEQLKSVSVEAGDVLLNITGDSVARVCVVDDSALPARVSQHVAIIRVNPESADPAFVAAFLASPTAQTRLLALASAGATRPALTKAMISEFGIELPALELQRSNGRLLGALDQRIARCREQAETLEAIAAATFKSRFVDFDGAGDFDESTHRRIPRGWTAGVLSDLGAPVNQKITADPSAVITLDQMPKQSTVLSDWKEFGGEKSLRSFSAGDVLFGKLRPYFHKVGVAPVDGACSTEILVLKPTDDAYWGLLLGHASSKAFIEHCVLHSTGTRMPRSEWKDIQAYPIAMPPRDVAEEFTSLARTYYARIHALIHQARTLAALRDALLPELVSGALPVPESLLEIYGGEEAPLAS